MPRVAQQLQELAAAAADVETSRRAGEERRRSRPCRARISSSLPRNSVLEAGVLMAAQPDRAASICCGRVGGAVGRGRGAERRRGGRRALDRGAQPRVEFALQRQRRAAAAPTARVAVRRARVSWRWSRAAQRLVALQHLVGQAAQPAASPRAMSSSRASADLRVLGRATRQAGELVVLGVDERRDRLQVDDQLRLEAGRLLDLAPHAGRSSASMGR